MAIRRRLEDIVVRVLMAALTAWVARELSPELSLEVERWLGYPLELTLLLSCTVVRPARWEPPRPAGRGEVGATSASHIRLTVRLERGPGRPPTGTSVVQQWGGPASK